MKASWLALLLLPQVVTTCATYHYRVERNESQRAIYELSSCESVVVDAIETHADEPVRLRLSRTDEVLVTTGAAGAAAGSNDRLALAEVRVDPRVVDGLEYEEKGRGTAAIVTGVVLTATTLFISAAGFILAGEHVGMIPIAGPIVVAIQRNDSAPAGIAVLHVLPIGLLVGGILASRPTHEVTDEISVSRTAIRWPHLTFAPTPGGGAAFQVLGTF